MQTTFIDGDLVYRPHSFEVPLNYDYPSEKTITVFAREIVAKQQQDTDLPWLVYLQGGPGFPSPRPDSNSGWLKRALQEYRVLLLDQRGTGQSTVISHQTLASQSTDQQVAYLAQFRADNIVRDAEFIREALKVKQWSILGQSFGGFCALHYLSYYPQSLTQAFITGGLASLTRHADDVYQATYQRVLDKNAQFFSRFPSAQQRCNEIANYLVDNHVLLPNGQHFTVEQFQLIGINLGRSGAELPMYYLLEDAFVEVDDKRELSYAFLNSMLMEQAYQTNPIYAILHESIYCQHTASAWSAHRVRGQYPQCHYQKGQDFCFTGEMVFPWMFDQLECLKPLKAAADLLAEKSDWPLLYDVDQLARNTVPVAAAVYLEDMYVEYAYSKETLTTLKNAKAWETNEYEHNGLKADGERILTRLIQLADEIDDRQI